MIPQLSQNYLSVVVAVAAAVAAADVAGAYCYSRYFAANAMLQQNHGHTLLVQMLPGENKKKKKDYYNFWEKMNFHALELDIIRIVYMVIDSSNICTECAINVYHHTFSIQNSAIFKLNIINYYFFSINIIAYEHFLIYTLWLIAICVEIIIICFMIVLN